MNVHWEHIIVPVKQHVQILKEVLHVNVMMVILEMGLLVMVISFFFSISFYLWYFNNNNNNNKDINECSSDNGGCDSQAMCANTIGTFTCKCKTGYSGDGFSCYGIVYFFFFILSFIHFFEKKIDIDECSTNNGGCSSNALCTNNPGSFSCACNSGYSGDGFTCTGKNSL